VKFCSRKVSQSESESYRGRVLTSSVGLCEGPLGVRIRPAFGGVPITADHHGFPPITNTNFEGRCSGPQEVLRLEDVIGAVEMQR
jgi:hypothetical protein